MRFLSQIRHAYKLTHLRYSPNINKNNASVAVDWDPLHARLYGSTVSGNSNFFKSRTIRKKFKRHLDKYKYGSISKRKSSRSSSSITPVAVISNDGQIQKVALIPINLFKGKHNDEEAFQSALAVLSLLKAHGDQIELFTEECMNLDTLDKGGGIGKGLSEMTKLDEMKNQSSVIKTIKTKIPPNMGHAHVMSNFDKLVITAPVINKNKGAQTDDCINAVSPEVLQTSSTYVTHTPATELSSNSAGSANKFGDMPVCGMQLNFEMDMANIKDALKQPNQSPKEQSSLKKISDANVALSTSVQLDSANTNTIPLHFNALINGKIDVNPKKLTETKLRGIDGCDINEYVTSIAAGLCGTALQKSFPSNFSPRLCTSTLKFSEKAKETPKDSDKLKHTFNKDIVDEILQSYEKFSEELRAKMIPLKKGGVVNKSSSKEIVEHLLDQYLEFDKQLKAKAIALKQGGSTVNKSSSKEIVEHLLDQYLEFDKQLKAKAIALKQGGSTVNKSIDKQTVQRLLDQYLEFDKQEKTKFKESLKSLDGNAAIIYNQAQQVQENLPLTEDEIKLLDCKTYKEAQKEAERRRKNITNENFKAACTVSLRNLLTDTPGGAEFKDPCLNPPKKINFKKCKSMKCAPKKSKCAIEGKVESPPCPKNKYDVAKKCSKTKSVCPSSVHRPKPSSSPEDKKACIRAAVIKCKMQGTCAQQPAPKPVKKMPPPKSSTTKCMAAKPKHDTTPKCKSGPTGNTCPPIKSPRKNRFMQLKSPTCDPKIISKKEGLEAKCAVKSVEEKTGESDTKPAKSTCPPPKTSVSKAKCGSEKSAVKCSTKKSASGTKCKAKSSTKLKGTPDPKCTKKSFSTTGAYYFGKCGCGSEKDSNKRKGPVSKCGRVNPCQKTVDMTPKEEKPKYKIRDSLCKSSDSDPNKSNSGPCKSGPKSCTRSSSTSACTKMVPMDVCRTNSCGTVSYDLSTKSLSSKCGSKDKDPCKKSSSASKCGSSGSKCGSSKGKDPCKKSSSASKCGSSGSKCGSSKDKDPCKKSDSGSKCSQKSDPCKKESKCGAKKDEDPCKKQSKCGAKKDENPCKKQSTCGAKKEDPCKKQSKCGAKKEDPCKKQSKCGAKKDENPCKKQSTCGAKKAEDPCKKQSTCGAKKEDPCKKQSKCGAKKDENPCKKQSTCGAKKEDPCKKQSKCGAQKAEDPCKKQSKCGAKKDEDPCKKQSKCGAQKAEDPCKKQSKCGAQKAEDPCKKQSKCGKSASDSKVTCQKLKLPPKKSNSCSCPNSGSESENECKTKTKCNKKTKDPCKNPKKPCSGHSKRGPTKPKCPKKSGDTCKKSFHTLASMQGPFGVKQSPLDVKQRFGKAGTRRRKNVNQEKEENKAGNAKALYTMKTDVNYMPALLKPTPTRSVISRCNFSSSGSISKEVAIQAPFQVCYKEKPIPEVGDNDVLVCIDSVALSDTDLYMFETGGKSYPELSLGNEAAGYVGKVGRNVAHLQVGDHIVLETGIPCCSCELCKKGHYNICSRMMFRGCLATACVIPAAFCYKISRDVPMEHAALAYQLAMACNACCRADIKPDSNVLIMGSCAMTVCTAMCAQCMGASNICVLCGQMNTKNIIDEFVTKKVETFDSSMKEIDVANKVICMLGLPPDIVIDCASCTTTMNIGIMAIRPAGMYIVSGFLSECVCLNMLDAIMKEIRIIPSFRSRNMIPLSISLLECGRVPIDCVLANCCQWKDMKFAFETALKEGNSGPRKVVVRCQSS